jgi:hypothetical protein
MLDQNMIDDLKANAEKLLNTAQALYNKSQELTANLSDKDTAQIIVAIEGYLELVSVGKKDTNNSRKIIVQELNTNAGMMG